MNILSIGNSFSQDAQRYLHDIAHREGETLETVNLYIGGCSLERHYRNMLSGQRAYELQCNGHSTGFFVSLEEALLSRAWDVVTIQQASNYSFSIDTYRPYAQALADYIRKYAPKAKLLVHQTWAYEEGSPRLREVAGYETADGMLADICAAYSHIAAEIGADGIIPSGQLLGKLVSSGIPKVHRDTFHASLGLGRYAIGLLWYKFLTGKSPSVCGLESLDEPISSEELAILKTCLDTFEPSSFLNSD